MGFQVVSAIRFGVPVLGQVAVRHVLKQMLERVLGLQINFKKM